MLLKDDALLTIRGATKRIVVTTDLDGDGLRDLVLSRGQRKYRPSSAASLIEAVSAKTGDSIRIYWSSDDVTNPVHDWDAGGDVNGDGCGDILLGFPRANGAGGVRCGRVEVRSGADGTVLHSIEGRASDDHLGYSVAFLGDLDGDGRQDLGIGAPQLVDAMPTDELQQPASSTRLKTRSGYVLVYSGRDCTELYSVAGKRYGPGFSAHLIPTGDADRDGVRDWIAECFDSVWVSGMTGLVFGHVPRKYAEATIAWGGDLDADGVADLLINQFGRDTPGVDVISGSTRTRAWQIGYPDEMSEFPTAVSLGDVDGDGHDDIGIGDGNFRLCGNPSFQNFDMTGSATGGVAELRAMRVADAMQIVSHPHFAFMSESGCALIYSGRTRKPIFGVYGNPDSGDGIGLVMASLPDVSGDGWPDVAIGGRNAIYVFAGPGGVSRDPALRVRAR